MPLPHESFSPGFMRDVKQWLKNARSARVSKEVWAVMHFDQQSSSVETFHSHSGMHTLIYKDYLEKLKKADVGDYN